eukprot:Clim_evm208s157 gene=Clim_evmTU208s157
MKWDANVYDNFKSPQEAWATSLIDLMDPTEGEHILDIGTGLGAVVKDLKDKHNCTAVGIDSSPEMIKAARQKYPDCEFRIAAAEALDYSGEFDAIITAATLHWCDQEKVLPNAYAALKPGGRFVGEFGGQNNIKWICWSIDEALKKHQISPSFEERSPWTFRGINDFSFMLDRHGFMTTYAHIFPRKHPLTVMEDGILDWYRMFGESIVGDLDQETQNKVFKTATELVMPKIRDPEDGELYADYVRIRFVAIKQ